MAKVALIDVRDKKEMRESENLGLANIASFLRGYGQRVDLFVANSTADADEQLRSFGFEHDLYGFTLFHANVDFVCVLAEKIKQKSTGLVCVGGRYATEVAEEILNDCVAIDFVVLGDGEEPLLAAAKLYPDWDAIANLATIQTRGRGTDVELSKFRLDQPVVIPARDFAYNENGRPTPVARLYSKRGCYCACSFCLINSPKQSKTREYESKTVSEIYDEIVTLYDRDGFRAFMFHDCPFDDAGTRGIEKIDALCDHLINNGTPLAFQCMLNGRLFNRERILLIRKMRTAGFSQIMYLIGAGSEHDMYIIKKQKGISKREESIELFENNDIEVVLEYFMLNPFTTIESFMDNYLFLTRRNCFRLGDFIRIAPVYMGTGLYDSTENAKLLDSGYSYKQPFRYRHQDPFIHSVREFFDTIGNRAELVMEDNNLENITYLFNWMRSIFPECVEPMTCEFNLLRRNISHLLKEYFSLVALKHDLNEAKRSFSEFEGNIMQLYKKVNNFQLRLVRQANVRQYLLRK